MADITKEELRKEITAILKDADLATMSAKKVRQQIEEKLDVDLMDRKKEVDNLVMECLQEKQDVKKESGTKKKSKDDDEEDEEEEEEEEEDEEEEEEEEEKAKPKRGGVNKKKRPKKGSSDESDEGSDEDASDDDYSPSKKAKGSAKKGKPAAKKKKGSDSDSDEDWAKSRKTNAGGGGAKKGGAAGGKRRGGGNTRPYTLSPELAAVVGQDTMARPEVVRKVWAIIKERNLFDPKNKQFAICDDELMKVFGVKRFRTFGMMKYLKNHFVD